MPLSCLTINATTILTQGGRTHYDFKRNAIQESIYGVDIESSAVDIAKLRLWLSLVVEEEDFGNIQPLPNLDYKIVVGNSLLGFPFDTSGRLDKLRELTPLKEKYFDTYSPSKKKELRSKINKIIDTEYNNPTTKKSLGYNVTFDFRWSFFEVFDREKGFDIVIANPPYVGEKGNKDTFDPIKLGNMAKYYQGKMDLFYFFFHLALNIGKRISHHSFITTNYYITAFGANKLRKDLHDRSIIRNLINFNELRIFETAKGQHNIITNFSKGLPKDFNSHNLITNKEGSSNPLIIDAILYGKDNETQYFEVSQKSLFDGDEYYIRLAGVNNQLDPVSVILGKIKDAGVSLGQICDVDAGIHPGVDKISKKIIKDFPHLDIDFGEGVFCLEQKEANKFEGKPYLKPLYKSSHIDKWLLRENKMHILYNSPHTAIEDETFQEHINKFKEVLIEAEGVNIVVAFL